MIYVSMIKKYKLNGSHKVQYEELDVRPDLSYEKEVVQILDRSTKTLCRKEVHHMGASGWDASMLLQPIPYRRWRYKVLAHPLNSLSFVCYCLLFHVACVPLGKFWDWIFLNGGGCKTLTVCLIGFELVRFESICIKWVWPSFLRHEYGMVCVHLALASFSVWYPRLDAMCPKF